MHWVSRLTEGVSQRGANQLVKTVIFALVMKGLVPGRTILQLLLGDNRSKARRDPDRVAGWLAL